MADGGGAVSYTHLDVYKRQEVARIPLFIWDPVCGEMGKHVKSLVQTIDLPATILAQFGLDLPESMEGIPLQNVLKEDVPVREAALFGLFGGQINCTDGRYVYMRSPVCEEQEICQYTLMPTRHGGRRAFIDNEELENMTLSEGFSFTKGLPVLKIPFRKLPGQADYPSMLFDLEQDPAQETLCHEEDAKKRMEPVSYTHLDVYKRQHHRGEWFSIFLQRHGFL